MSAFGAVGENWAVMGPSASCVDDVDLSVDKLSGKLFQSLFSKGTMLSEQTAGKKKKKKKKKPTHFTNRTENNLAY